MASEILELNPLPSASSSSREIDNSARPERTANQEFQGDLEAPTSLQSPPVDGGRDAWLFLFGAFLVEIAVWGFPDAFGVFLDAYLVDLTFVDDPRASSLLPLVGTSTTGLMYFASPFVYPALRRRPQYQRLCLWIGLLLCASSLLGASFAQTVPQLIALQGVVYGIGGSLLYAPCISFMNDWFVRKRGLANGVITAGTSVGGLTLPLILPPLLKAKGPSVTLRILADMLVAIVAPMLIFVRPRLGGSMTIMHMNGARQRSQWLRDTMLWFVLATNALQGLAYFVPLLWLPAFATAMEIPPNRAALSLVLLNGMQIISRLAVGHLADHVSPWLLALTTLSATSVATFVVWGITSHNLAGVLGYGAVYGALSGGWSSIWTGFLRPIARDDGGVLTELYGLMMLTRGLGNILTGPISSSLHRGRKTLNSPLSSFNGTNSGLHASEFDVASGTFRSMIIYVGACYAGAALLAVFGWAIESVKQRRISLRAQSC